MKIFMYETAVGSMYRPHRSGGYAVERIFQENLVKSKFVTKNANEATFFFIPIQCSSYILSQPTEEDGVRLARNLSSTILNEIKKYPYWNWSGGSDHFYICAHDIGASIAKSLFKNSVALVNTADYDDPYFIPQKDISLPPTPGPGLSKIPSFRAANYNRKILAFFAGDMSSGRIRPHIWNLWANDDDILLIDGQISSKNYVENVKIEVLLGSSRSRGMEHTVIRINHTRLHTSHH